MSELRTDDAPGGEATRQADPTPASDAGKGRRRLGVWASRAALVVILLALVAYFVPIDYAYVPGDRDVLGVQQVELDQAFDLWGRRISRAEAAELEQTEEGRAQLSPANGAVSLSPEMVELGRRAFYNETFGNEIFLTDVLGTLDGPITLPAVAKAVLALGGKPTHNLEVALAKDATIGGRQFRKGEVVRTGLDVPAGALAPLGMKVSYRRGRIRVGISCALCHAAVDARSGKVIHGAPNNDLNAGLILAMGTNTASYLAHAEFDSLEQFQGPSPRMIPVGGGKTEPLPDPKALEDAVDAVLLKWSPGNFDSMIELKAAATQHPTAWARDNHPYTFSGLFAVGPFRGLNALNNNVHGINSDALTSAELMPALHGIDKEVFLGAALQNAARSRFRYDPTSGETPSAFFDRVNPTPRAPGINEMVVVPTYPRITPVALASLLVSKPGYPVWHHVNAISAFQWSLVPPRLPIERDAATFDRGRRVFERANCQECHNGPALTNNRVIPAREVGTEPTRAAAMKDAESFMAEPILYAFDTPVPLPEDPRTLRVPMDVEREQFELAHAFGDSPGGYKVLSLVGLYWSAPYLHDGGVAVGPDPGRQLGLPGTVRAGVLPDPAESLRALVDRGLRARVVAANDAEPDLQAVRVRGVGHDYWVDAEAGFDRDEQDALIHYLLTFEPEHAKRAPRDGDAGRGSP